MENPAPPAGMARVETAPPGLAVPPVQPVLPPSGPQEVRTFEQVYADESRHLDAAAPEPQPRPTSRPQVRTSLAGEPSVCFTPHDRFGLALSGGGVRSATFNLGLLQALARRGILAHVDYLSTVSGGGYIGAFWTTWLHRRGKRTGAARFPVGNDARGGERSEIRHLREFSRFLLPRVGFLQTEFWAIVMTVLGGMLPSLLAALALLGAAWYVWVIGLVALTYAGFWGTIASAGALYVYLLVAEIKWLRAGRAEHNDGEIKVYLLAVMAAALAVALQVSLRIHAPDLAQWRSFADAATALAMPKTLAVCTLMLLGLRIVGARVCREPSDIPALTGLERCATRLLAVTVGLTLVSLLWLVAREIAGGVGDWRLKLTAGGAAASAAIFAWAKRWLAQPVTETRGGTFWRFALSWLKRATPKALAALVWLLLFVVVGALVHRFGEQAGSVRAADFWLPFAASGLVIGLVALLFDPARVGLHDFYRSRLARCYLGASNVSMRGSELERVTRNRHVAERADDDLRLGQLREIQRPIHLVCVAANDMSGDPLGNLYRGARSAVLSMHGISLGNQTASLDHLRLSAAVTASAAAFNSQMGRVSMDLGPAVGFLMSALNLRLGLWVPHPSRRNRGRYRLPGRFFLAELLGMSTTQGHNLHLSDGNHFENFGLYELVRRHCRYIIVSDCGADPEVAFDDLANVLRRVREDFGVEIELDISPLRPDAHNRVRQHAVAGTVHYNGIAGMDKGTILFFKAALTGDEPPDVLQYSTRNGAFPHESTGDQFYDEAQWESYRRLGEHAVDAALGFFESPGATGSFVDRLFRDARSRWQPAPDNHHTSHLEISQRCAAFEEDLMRAGPERLRAEFFAEAAALAALAPSATASPAPAAPAPTLADDLQILGYLARVGQIMEDIWVAVDLERNWSHPLCENWMNYFRRWAATPSFRRWWPVLASLYGLGLREFVGQRFRVGAVDPAGGESAGTAPSAQLFLRPVADPVTFFAQSFVAAQFRQGRSMPVLTGRTVLAFDLALRNLRDELDEHRLPIGLVVVREERTPPAGDADTCWTVTWEAPDLFVSEALYGAGFISKFLDAILRHYRLSALNGQRIFTEARVHFGAQPADGARRRRPDPATRYERVRDIEFYKSRGFSYVAAEDPPTGAITLCVRLVSGAASAQPGGALSKAT